MKDSLGPVKRRRGSSDDASLKRAKRKKNQQVVTVGDSVVPRGADGKWHCGICPKRYEAASSLQKHHNDKHAAVSASDASTTMKFRQRVGSAAQTPNPSHNASTTAQQLRRAPVEALVPLSGQPRRRPSSSRPGSKATMIPGPVSYNAPVSTPIAPPFVSEAAPGAAQGPEVRSPPPSSHTRSESNAGPELATQPRNMPIKVAAPRCPTPQPPPPPPPNSAPVEINIQARENVPNRGTAVFDASHGLPEVGVIINANGLKITVTVR